jgi:hypothetical protein
MNIYRLPIGKKLIWDPGTTFPGTDNPIIYPAIIEKKDSYDKSVMIKMQTSSQWMDEEETSLREPYEDELQKYKWPEV